MSITFTIDTTDLSGKLTENPDDLIELLADIADGYAPEGLNLLAIDIAQSHLGTPAHRQIAPFLDTLAREMRAAEAEWDQMRTATKQIAGGM